MTSHPLAGQPAPVYALIDVAQLERAYYKRRPDTKDPNQLVSFGTSGHRGTPTDGSFTESHILAITQAICAALKALTGRSSWARTRMPSPDRPSASVGGQWRGDRHSTGRRHDADAGDLARHPGAQSRWQR